MDDVELQLSEDDLESARIVVIDDEPVITDALRVFFRHEMGLTSTSFNDSSEAVAYLRENEVEQENQKYTTYSVSIEKRYRDGETWKTAKSFKAHELLQVAYVATEAYKRALQQRQQQGHQQSVTGPSLYRGETDLVYPERPPTPTKAARTRVPSTG